MYINTHKIRSIILSKGYILDAAHKGDTGVIPILNRFRNEYIRQVGLNTYLSEMLAEMGNTPAGECQIYFKADKLAEIHQNEYNTPIQKYLRRFAVNDLPYKIVSGGKVKYL